MRLDEYQCDRAAFQQRLQHAHTVRIDTERLDLFAASEVRKVLPELGLREVSGEEKADLIIHVSPVDRNGRIDFGPAAAPLATLNVYDPARGAGRLGLIWSETFFGTEDRPWPSVVTALLRQFQDHARSH